MLYTRLAETGDALQMFPNLRDADRAELKASGGRDSPEALADSVTSSTRCFAILDETGVIALFGYTEETPTLARVWMLATPQIEQHSRRFIRECRKWVDWMNTKYSTLYNFYYEPNTLHQRWLVWCGFTIGSRHNIGTSGEPFRIFHRNKNHV